VFVPTDLQHYVMSLYFMQSYDSLGKTVSRVVVGDNSVSSNN